MKKRINSALKMRRLVFLGLAPLAIIATAASCGQSDNSASEAPTNHTPTTMQLDWFEAPYEPRINPNNIPKLAEAASINAINERETVWGRIISDALRARMSNSATQATWGTNSAAFFEHKVDGKVPGIEVFGLEPLTNVPKLVSDVLAGIINEVWQISNTQENDDIDPDNLVPEIMRLTKSDVSGYQKLKMVFDNYLDPTVETSDLTKNAWFSWVNLAHFVRIAVDPTPSGLYPYEGLIAMLKPLGKTAIEAFNENISQKWELKAKVNVGGYNAKKLDLQPRKIKK